MTTTKDNLNLSDVKQVLRKFAASRAHGNRSDAEQDFGALLLYLVRLAGTLEIDLAAAGELSVERTAASRPRMISSGRDRL
jgi:hypothetical protein